MKVLSNIVSKHVKSSVPQYLYHASPLWNRENILEEGLKINSPKTFEESVGGYIYLTESYGVAVSWIEDMFESQIPDFDKAEGVVFKIDTSYLDYSMLTPDVVIPHSPGSYSYAENIPAESIVESKYVDLGWDMDVEE